MIAGVKSIHGKFVKEAVNHEINLWDAHDSEPHLLSRTLIYVSVRHHDVSLGRHKLPCLPQLVTLKRYITEEE